MRKSRFTEAQLIEMIKEEEAGIDVSLEESSVCVVATVGRIVSEARVVSEPAALFAWFAVLGHRLARISLEAGPLLRRDGGGGGWRERTGGPGC